MKTEFFTGRLNPAGTQVGVYLRPSGAGAWVALVLVSVLGLSFSSPALASQEGRSKIRAKTVSKASSTSTRSNSSNTRRAKNKKTRLAMATTLASAEGTTTATQNDVLPVVRPKSWNLALTAERGSSLQGAGDPSRVTESSFTMAPSFQLTDRFKLNSVLTLTDQETGERNTTLSNARVSVSHRPFEMTENLKAVPAATVILPTNRIAYKTDRFQGGYSLSGRLLVDPKWSYGVKGFYGMAFTQNVHEYNLNAYGSPNIQYLLAHSAGAELPIWRKFSASVGGSYSSGWTYRGKVRNQFGLSQQIGYAATSAWSLYLGHSTGGSAARANGRDSNIQFFNENKSILSAGTTYVF